jgi:cytochrome P450
MELLARTCERDVKLGGQQLHAGDRVMLSWSAANFDEKAFERPDELILDRFPNRHATFGFGIHRCIGLHIARYDFATILGEVLKRMPDFRIIDAQKYQSCGINHGWKHVYGEFTPGKRSGQVSVLDDIRPAPS